MASVKLEHIYKVYPNGVKAVNDFTMDIKDGEFIVFVGPSGCGKSTTLRMIAGLEEITAGELYIDERIVNDIEPKDRDIAMVFQNYALYPHMTVYENMAFGLRLRHLPNDVIHDKVMWAADILGLKEYLDRKPKAMSGGQRQRVALGRAILRNPKVMLLDEPLSNLDAKLRTQMRSEISKLHVQLATTFVYVTHDQVEAMTLGDRVVVMSMGHVQQIDSPKNLYQYPKNKFVAGFIGTPQMNFFIANLKRKGEVVDVKFKYSAAKISVPLEELIKANASYLTGTDDVYVGIRCEDVRVATSKDDKNLIDVKVSHFEELGNEVLIYGDINMDGDGFTETNTRIIVRARDHEGINSGDIIKCTLDMSACHLFDMQTEETIIPRIPLENVFEAKINKGKLALLGGEFDLRELTSDTSNSEVLVSIPTAAIQLSKNGPVSAKCKRIEEIGDKFLAHLVHKNRTFFAFVPDNSALNKEVKLDFDFTAIGIKKEEEVLVTPLSLFDRVSASFVNHATLQKVQPDSPYINAHSQMMKEANDEVNKQKEELLAKQKEELQAPELLEKEIAELNEKLLKAKEKSQKLLEEKGAAILENKKEYEQALNAKEASQADVQVKFEAQALENSYRYDARIAKLKKEMEELKAELAKRSDRGKYYQKKHQEELVAFEQKSKAYLDECNLLYHASIEGGFEAVKKEVANIQSERDALLEKQNAAIDLALEQQLDGTLKQKYIETKALEKANKEKISQIQIKRKEELARYKKEEKEAIAKAKEENARIFRERKEREKTEYAAFRSVVHDKTTYKARKEAHKVFMENFGPEKNGDLQNRLVGIDSVYEGKYLEARLANKRAIKMLSNEIKDAYAELKILLEPKAHYEKEHHLELRKFEASLKAYLRRSSMLFYFGINGHYEVCSNRIANKIIQGLGTRVFEKNYLIDVPHDAYTFNEGSGLALEVLATKAYEGIQYLECRVVDANVETKILVKGSAKVGAIIHVNVDLERTMITESQSGIRLY